MESFKLLLGLLILTTISVVDVLAQCTATPSGIISWWPAGGNAGDVVYSNNGTAMGSVNYTNGMVGSAFNFDGGSYGNGPVGGLTLAPNGKLYGTAEQGGANGVGVLFSIDPATNIYTKVYDFNGTNGIYPTGRSLTLASNGKLYGTTYQGGQREPGCAV